MPNAYDFSFTTLQGQPYALKDLTGRPFVVVNTASKCGFTPQYKVVIGVPSNDFAGQEPGTAEEISSFCELNYGVDFPMMSKVHVKGPEAHPFFKWAGSAGGFMAAPKWNFFKYLVGKDGQLVEWFSSITAPDSGKFQSAVAKMLGQ
jgi:glutathione peroxidase